MAGPTHDAEVLAAWQSGETRMVYARHKADHDAPLYYLVDGTAKQVRPWAKEHLECPIPGCPQPALTTVSRTARRDGFKHGKGAGGHGIEGLSHLQGKALIARWVTEHYPDVRVEPEAATTSKARRADVLLTWPDGQQVAIEIQYAGLTVDAWRERHASYRAQGIVDVWLLGHVPPHLRRAKKLSWEPESVAEGQVSLGALHKAILAAGLPLLWLYPEREEIGLSWQEHIPDRLYPRDPDGLDGTTWAVPPQADDTTERALFRVVPLTACALGAEGFTAPGYDVLLRNAARLAEINADRHRRCAAREAAAAALRASKAAEDAARRSGAEVRREQLRLRRMADAERHHAQLPVWEQQWLGSDLRQKVIARYDGIPDVIASKVGPIEGVLAYPEHWHAVIYGHLILGKKPGDRWVVSEVYKVLRGDGVALHPDDRSLLAETLTAYVRHLASVGLVLLGQKPRDRHINYVEVVGSIEIVAQQKAAEAEERRRQAAEKQRVRAAEAAQWEEHLEYARQKREARKAAAAAQTERAAGPPPSAPREILRCRKCHWPLDERFAAEGLHIGC